MCRSWPQACMTPTSSPFQVVRTFEANGRSTSSVTGRASMSARSATTGPGSAPLSRPTTPVWATPVRTSSRPSARRCSATSAAVRNSRLPSSGLAWMSRRQPTTSVLDRGRRRIDARGEGGCGDRLVGHGSASVVAMRPLWYSPRTPTGGRIRLRDGPEGRRRGGLRRALSWPGDFTGHTVAPSLRPPRRAARVRDRLDGGVPLLLRPGPLRLHAAGLLSRSGLDLAAHLHPVAVPVHRRHRPGDRARVRAGLAALLAPLGPGGGLCACW